MNKPTLQVGYIPGPHGLRGEVRVHLHSPESEVLSQVDVLQASPRSGPPLALHITAVRPHKREWLVTFREISDRTAAEALKGATLHVSPDSLPPLGEDEFYLEQILGYRVIDRTAGPLGTVRGFLTTTIEMLSVVDDEGRETLVPLLDGVVEELDDSNRTVFVALPDGLLD